MRRARTRPQNQELEELSQGFQLARETVRARLRGQVADAHGAGAVGVEFSHSVRREKLAPRLLAADRATGEAGRRGRFGMPYRVSGHSDAERRGWMITMHAAGTAIRAAPSGRRRASGQDRDADGEHVTDYDPTSLEGIPESGVSAWSRTARASTRPI